MDQITPIVNEYWFGQAKKFIQTNLVSTTGLSDAVRAALAELYNQITIENGLDSLDKARKIINEMHKINGIELDKKMGNISMGVLITGLLIIGPGDTLFGTRKFYKDCISPLSYCLLFTGCLGSFIYGMSRL